MFLAFSTKKIKNKTKKILTKKYGRNHGQIVCHHRSGSLKRKYIFLNNNIKKGLILNIKYDPNQTTFTAKILIKQQNKYVFKYQKCSNFSNILCNTAFKKHIQLQDKEKLINQTTLLKNLAVGDIICNVQKNPENSAVFAKSAGTFAQILEKKAKKDHLIKIKLPSKEQYLISETCTATLGQNSNKFHQHLQKWKAGVSRKLGVRPKVRGVAKNPIDHPHGGAGKSSTGGVPRTPWGKPTKGFNTRKKKKNSFFIALHRKHINNNES